METTDGVSRAVALLQEVTQLLVAQTDCSSTVPAHLLTQQPQTATSMPDSIADSSHAAGSPGTSNALAVAGSGSASGGSSCSTSQSPPIVSPTSRQLNILQSFSGLFSPYNRPSSSRLTSNPGPSGCGRSRSVFQPPKPSKRNRFVPKETWTHDFFCLPSPTATIAPQRSTRTFLQEAGLGRKKIVFNKGGDAIHVQSKVEEAFPKLVNGGGFEILRSAGSSSLSLIKAPTCGGYTVPFLRDLSGLGQALAYVRPIQKELELEPMINEANEKIENHEGTRNVPSVKCFICQCQFPVNVIREHQHVCKKEDQKESVYNKEYATQSVMDICCNKSKKEVEDALHDSNWCISEAVNKLLEESHPVQDQTQPLSQIHGSSMKDIISFHAGSIIDNNQQTKLAIRREEIWRGALGFYKVSLKDPSCLAKTLFVDFEGEEGVDAGALRLEFFELVVKEVRQRLFEGDEHLIPRRSMGSKGCQFQVAGTVIAHSVLQGGPAFPFLAPWVFEYLIHGETEKMFAMMKLSDITMSASTCDLLEFIKMLDEAKCDAELDAILDESNQMSKVYWQQINMSDWSISEPISMNNKAYLIEELVRTELFKRRKDQLTTFKQGLQSLGFLTAISPYEEQMRSLFLPANDKLTPEKFKSLLESSCKKPEAFAESNAFQWFMEYIDDSSNEPSQEFPEGKISTLLHFITGLWNIPPLGLETPITVNYLDDDDQKELPEATSCLSKLLLPTVHSNQETFCQKIDKALIYGHSGFGFY